MYLAIGLENALASEYYTENFVSVVSIGKEAHDLSDYTWGSGRTNVW